MKKSVYFLSLLSIINFSHAQVESACDLPDFNLYVTDSGEVWYNSSSDIAGLQFNVNGATVNAVSGGDAAAAGFTLSSGGTTVLGFSFSGAVIPAGCGTLLELDLTNPADNLSDLIMAGVGGSALDFSYYEGNTGGGDDTCEDENACNFGQEGDCDYPEENYDCDGNCSAPIDCNGECGGNLIPDYVCDNGDLVCNETDCDNDGNNEFQNPCDLPSMSLYLISDNDSGEIWYNSSSNIAGFQFDFDDTIVTEINGGDAAAAGFSLSTGDTTVLGFSFSGAVIPAGCGVLFNFSVEGEPSGISNIIFFRRRGNIS